MSSFLREHNGSEDDINKLPIEVLGIRLRVMVQEGGVRRWVRVRARLTLFLTITALTIMTER